MLRNVYIPYTINKISILEYTVNLSGNLNLNNIYINS